MSVIDGPDAEDSPTGGPALAPGWTRVQLALLALAVDPAGLGGLWLRARSGPVRDAVTGAMTGALSALPLPVRRLHPSLGDEALFGGLDLTATLAEGRQVRNEGLLARPSTLVLAMAERCPAGLAARLAQALDAPRHCLLALDEGAEPEEALPPALADRLALFLSLDDIPLADAVPLALDRDRIVKARARLGKLRVPPRAAATLTGVAARLGIDSLRAPMLALRLARVIAALRGHAGVRREDVTTAAELVFAHRATRWPESDPASEPAEAPPEPSSEPDGDSRPDPGAIPDELVLEAVRATLPENLLDRLAVARAARAMAGATGAGEARAGHRHGRPLAARPGRPSAGLRLDLIATLRAAAPWQVLRRQTALQDRLVHIRPSDLRIRRYQERRERVLIFAVDASGSAALARLAEAKGAVELLLARAYARRDHVALIAFRGAGADLVLPPTRSLVQTKRRLAGVPGGGGTPLAAALQLAGETAMRARAKGLTPVLALLTDGRANVALDGTPGRARAEAEAEVAAQAWRRMGFPGVVIDTATRPQDGLRHLSATLGAAYLPLPRASAERLSSALEAALAPMQAG